MNLSRVSAHWLGPGNPLVASRGELPKLPDPDHRLGDEFEVGYRKVLRAGPFTEATPLCRSPISDKDHAGAPNRRRRIHHWAVELPGALLVLDFAACSVGPLYSIRL